MSDIDDFLYGSVDLESTPASISRNILPAGASFKEAFKYHRANGDRTFEWNGQKYTTALAEPTPPKPKGQAPAPQASAPKPKAQAPAPARRTLADVDAEANGTKAPARKPAGQNAGDKPGAGVKRQAPGSSAYERQKAAALESARARPKPLDKAAAAVRRAVAGRGNTQAAIARK